MYNFYKKCEESLKNTILKLYGIYLSESQIYELMNKEYVTDEVMGIKKLNDTFIYFMNKMLNDLINVTYIEKTVIDDEEVSIKLGTNLKKVLVNFYKVPIIKSIGGKTSDYIKHEYDFDLDLLNLINVEYDHLIDKNAFNKNAKELSQIEELSMYTLSTFEKDISDHLEAISIKM